MRRTDFATSARIVPARFLHLTLAAILGLGALTASLHSHAASLQPRLAIDKNNARFMLPGHAQYERIVVKFNEGSDIVQTARGLLSAARNPAVQAELKAIEQRSRSEGLALRKLFSRFDNEGLAGLKRQVENSSGRQLADLNLYFELPVPSSLSQEKLQRLINFLNSQDSVEVAYASAPAQPAAVKLPNASSTPAYDGNQTYRQAAPAGIDAAYAWTVPGGRGLHVRVADVEGGWRMTHEDMPLVRNLGGAMSDPVWVNHGTAVLGVMGARDNGYGMSGLVPDASFSVAGIGTMSPAEAILKAGADVGRGGVVVVEMQRVGPADSTACSCNTSQCNALPMEYWPAEYDAIQYLVAQGISVVEAAGNGSVNLDDPVYNRAFDRSVRDSGAILVAASQAYSRTPMCYTNAGSRIDVHGWGEGVATLGYGDLSGGPEDRWYTSSFSGTSSAAPIVASAVASIQGVHLTRRGDYMTPAAVRQLLHSSGTPQASELNTPIGPLPNLRAALTTIAPATSGQVLISGTIRKGTAAAAFTSISGAGASCSVNAAAGTYSCTVANGWNGTLTPAHAGSVFTPAQRSYAGVQANRTAQDFQMASSAQIAITGNINDNGRPLANVQILVQNTSGTATCNSSALDGNYRCEVSSGWSGSLSALANGYTFTTASRSYSGVTSSMGGQDFTTAVIQRTASIYYKRGFATPYIHYRVQGGNWTGLPGIAMSDDPAYCGYSRHDIVLGSASSVEVAFNDGLDNWDSNFGSNYWFGEGNSTYDSGSSAAGTPNAVPCKQAVTFKVTATSVWGENIYIVGNVPELGNWDVAKALKLDAGSYPVWSTTVQLGVPVAFEYKYVRKNAAGVVTWEGGSNRSLSLTGGAPLTREDGNFRP